MDNIFVIESHEQAELSLLVHNSWHVLDHLEQHKILTDLQHGFRSGRSCETQLITTFQDIAEMYDKKGSQIDIAVLDFSKAFDTVPHDGLFSKLKHYGIDKNIWQWISNF